LTPDAPLATSPEFNHKSDKVVQTTGAIGRVAPLRIVPKSDLPTSVVASAIFAKCNNLLLLPADFWPTVPILGLTSIFRVLRLASSESAHAALKRSTGTDW
jgi:hypothetical protein